MPLPLIPLGIGLAGLLTGAVLSGDNSEAQVIVNPAPPLTPSGQLSLTQGILLATVAVGAVTVLPRVMGK